MFALVLDPGSKTVGDQQFIGKYQIEERLGSGTFATVYRCFDPDLESTCAIKVLADNWSEDESARTWFLNEARLMFGIEHPAILRIFTSGTLEDGRPYFVMEYADQGSLADWMRQRRSRETSFDIHKALDISIAISDGLIVAHQRGLVHRDLKPSNILFRSQQGASEASADDEKERIPQVKLADFGLARKLEQGANSLAGAGTPHYIAPEQAKSLADDRPDVRSDIYSAATILYEMVSGQVPFPYQSMTQVIAAHLNEEITSVQELAPGVPAEMASVIHAGLSRDPELRVPTAQVWKQQLQVLRNALNPDGSIAGWASASAPSRPPDDDPLDDVDDGDDTWTIPIERLTETRVQPTQSADVSSSREVTDQIAARTERSNPMAGYVFAAVALGLFVVGLLGFALSDLVAGGDDSGTDEDTPAVVDDDADDGGDDAEVALPEDPDDDRTSEASTPTPESTATPTPEPSPTPEPDASPTPEPEEDPSIEPIRAILQDLPGDYSGAVVLPSGAVVEELADEFVPAGGTITLWIAASAFDAAAAGDLDLDDEYTITEGDQVPGTGMLNSSDYVDESFTYEEIIGIMLLYSDNSAANILTDAIGGMARVNEYADEHAYESTQMQRRLGSLNPDQENYTSAADGMLFMSRLLDDEIVNAEASSQIRSILEQRSNNATVQYDFFGRELADDVDHANISGLLPGSRNEVGYIELSDDAAVVISLMLTSLDDESGGESAIAEATAEIYEELSSLENSGSADSSN